MERCHTSSPNPKKVQVQRSAGKVMLTFFCDYKRPILENYMPRGSTVTSATYSILEGKSEASYSPETARVVDDGSVFSTKMRSQILLQQVSTIEELLFECIPHPLYSPLGVYTPPETLFPIFVATLVVANRNRF